MTIKELETLVGMTQANIRFYEQEGLIPPAPLPNGYRNYSEGRCCRFPIIDRGMKKKMLSVFRFDSCQRATLPL